MAKKILIFSTAYLPLIGGAEIAIKELTDRLAGFDFDLITARLKTDLAKQEKIGRVTIYRVGLGNKLDKFLLPILGLAKAFTLNKKNNYGIIWSLMASQASVAAAFLKFIFPEKKLILNLQEGDEEEHLKRYVLGNDFLYKIFIRPWHLLVFKKADYITAISADLKNRAKNNGATAATEIIPNGVDLDKFKIENKNFKIEKLKSELNISASDKVVITISRLVKKNGVGDLIEAMSYLSQDVKLIIIGEGELRDNLKSKIENLKLDNRVIMLGAINNEIVPEYLAMADVFVRPSLSEGQGIAFLEAMAAGVPVIATQVGGIIDFLRDNETGLFCEVKNPKSIVEKIKIYLEKNDLTENIKVKAKEMVIKNYSWDLIAKKTEDVFNKNSDFINSKIKVLIATGIYPPDIGGPATHILQFIDFIKDKEFNFKIVTFSDSNENNINIFRILRKQNIFNKFLEYFVCILKNVKNADIIYLHDVSIAGLAVFLASFLSKKKYILRMGGDFIWEQAYQAHKTTLKYKDFQREKMPRGFKLRSFIAKTIAKRAAKIIVPSNFLKDAIILWGIDSSKIVVVYNAISDCFAEAKPVSSIYEKIDNFKKQNYKIFISNGRFVNWKKFNYLIEVFKDINNAKLFIIGDGPEKDNLINLISKNNLKDKIFLLNKIPRQELLKLYEISDFFILFSVGDTFSFSCLEAFLCGLNLVISREGAFEEIFSEFKDRGVKFIDLDDKNDVIKIINDAKIYKIKQEDIENLKSKYNYIESFNSICNIILEIKKDENF